MDMNGICGGLDRSIRAGTGTLETCLIEEGVIVFGESRTHLTTALCTCVSVLFSLSHQEGQSISV